MAARRTPLYRLLHGSPMLAGIPVTYLLGLLGAGVAGGVGAMAVSRLVGLLGLMVLAAVWGVLGLVFARDRVVVPLLLLRLVHRFPSAISSYAPAYLQVRVVGDEPGRDG